MPETTTTQPRRSLRDFINNADFIDMPYARKIREIAKVVTEDYDFEKLDDDAQIEAIGYVLSQGARPYPSLEGPTGTSLSVPSAEETAQTSFTAVPQSGELTLPTEPEQPTAQPQQQPAVNAAPVSADPRNMVNLFLGNTPEERKRTIAQQPAVVRIPVQAAVKGIDTLPGMVAPTVGGMLDFISGGTRYPLPGNVEAPRNQFATALQSRAVTSPAETALVGKEGFIQEDTAGLRILQHTLNAGASGVAGGLAFGAALNTGVPLTPGVIRGALLSAQGGAAGGSVREMGGGPWAQAATELVAGGASLAQVGQLFKYLATRPGLQNVLANLVRRDPNFRDKLDEFTRGKQAVETNVGAPAPTVEGTLGTMTGNPQVQSIEQRTPRMRPASSQAFVERTEGDLVNATGAITSRLPAPNPDLVTEILDRAASPVIAVKEIAHKAGLAVTDAAEKATLVREQTRAALDTIKARTTQRIEQITDRKRHIEDTLDDMVRQRSDDLRQLEADQHFLDRAQLAERRRLADEKRAEELGLRKELDALRTERDTVLKQADDAIQAADDAVKDTATTNTKQVRAAKDAQDAAEKELDALNTQARDAFTQSVVDITPDELIRATDDPSLVTAKLTRFERAAQKARTLYDNGYQRFTTEAGLPTRYGNPVYRDLNRSRPNADLSFEQDLQRYQDRMQAQMRESYIPDPALDNMLAIVQEKGADLTFYDLHTMRSRLLDDVRHAPVGTRKESTLKSLLGIVQAKMDTAAKQGGFGKQYEELSQWYKSNIRRYTTGFGALATKIDPLTGKPFYDAAELAQRAFAPGPGGGQVTGAQARNKQAFQSYLRDIDAFIKDQKLKPAPNLRDLHEAEAARESLFDIARTQFYVAVVDPTTGQMDARKAVAWVRNHASLINQSPELQSDFLTPQQRLRTIQELEDRSNQLLTRRAADVTDAQRTAQVASEEGRVQLLTTERAQREPRAQARAGFDTGEADIAARREALTDAQIAEQRALEDQRNAFNDEVFQARQDLYSAQGDRLRGRREAAQAAREETTRVEARAEAEGAPYRAEEQAAVDAKRLADHAKRLADTDVDAAVADYDAFFGGGAAERANRESRVARDTLGFEARDRVAQIEAGDPEKRLRMYEGLFNLAGNDPVTVKTILGAMWEHHQRGTGKKAQYAPGQPLLATPAEVMDFLKTNERVFAKYLPEYAKDLKDIATIFERYDGVAKANAPIPLDVMPSSLGENVATGAMASLLARLSGFGYMGAYTVGKLVFMGERMMNALNIQMLSNMLLDPETTGVMARIVNPQTNPRVRRTLLTNFGLRSGALAETIEEE